MHFCPLVYKRAARAPTSKNFVGIEKEVDRIPALKDNRPNVCIGTDCMPFEAGPEMVLKVKERIYLSVNIV